MRSKHHSILVPLAFIALLATVVPGQAQTSWKGKTVVPRTENVRVYPDLRKGQRATLGTIERSSYRVLDQFSDNLKIRHKSKFGWVRQSDMFLPEQAIEHFSNLIKVNKANYYYHLRRGLAYRLVKKHDEAIADYTQAIRFNPNLATLYNNRGLAWVHKKKYDKAMIDYNKAIQLAPTSANYYYNRGAAWYFKQDYDKAIADFTKSLTHNAKNPAAYSNRGLMYFHKKQHDKALADFRRALELRPDLSNAYYNRGRLWLECKKYDKALQDFGAAMRYNPKDARAAYSRGVIHSRTNKSAKALADFDRALKLNPKYTAAMNGLAWILATSADKKLRDAKRALQLSQKACKLTSFRKVLYVETLAAAHAANGQFTDAVWWQKKALESQAYRRVRGEEGQRRLRLFENKKSYRK